ncbi:uncharacterized protein LOC125294032 [Alosa alosa]|uniref:uncharacterized protein LOC125294032 n=1 Tax=Alosa alosa TaxID=278164 RepID=UPI0020151FD8|nr:uncharacterized protein LOC125294032 [Alosa alosa]XP_048098319.1 uncharacterized protein LOC125294032 [Alosa alosa]
METDNVASPPSPQLLFLGQKSTKRLLEVYVKRTLSLNDNTARPQRVKPRKWVIVDSKGNRIRKASSDSSTYRLSREISQTEPKEPSTDTTNDSHQTKSKKTEIKPQTQRITKKASILRSFISLFSRKNHEAQNSASVPDTPVFSGPADGCFATDACPPVPEMPKTEGDGKTLRHSKSIKKRLSLKKLSFRSHHDAEKLDSVRRQSSLAPADVVRVPDAIVCVEPSSAYFEKVSEELERIVKEVKESPTEEEQFCAAILTDPRPAEAASDSIDDIIERMVDLLKEHGDEINEKIRRNSSVSSFFQKLNYNNFQQLADRYVAAIPDPLPQSTTAPPQLVKLAFTLDFTAKVAGLSSQAIGRIMGFGNQYIQDRFTQMTSANCLGQQSQNMGDQSLMDQD